MTSFMPRAAEHNGSEPKARLSFGEYFWSNESFGRLKNYVRESCDFCKKVSDIMSERALIEHRYAKEISALSHKLIKSSTEFMGTISNAYHSMAVEFDLEAENHRLFANSINDEIVKPLRYLLETQGKKRKQLESIMTKVLKHYLTRRQDDFKCRQKIHQLVNMIEDASSKLGNQDSASLVRSSAVSVNNAFKLENNIRRLECQLEAAEQKYTLATVNVEHARQDMDLEVIKVINVVEDMEREKLSQMNSGITKIAACMEILGERTTRMSQKLYAVDASVDADLREIALKLGDSSLQEPEVLLYDSPAEDMRIQMDKNRRQYMLTRWISKFEESIMQQDRSLEGIDNLANFCHGNGNFALQEQDVHTKRVSLKLLRALYEASLYKFKASIDSLNHQPIQSRDVNWLLVHTYEKGMPLTFARLPHSFSLVWKSTIVDGTHNVSLSDDRKLATGRHIRAITNGSEETKTNPCLPRCIAQFHYSARRPDELTISPGDILMVLEKRPDHWWRGQLGQMTGLFPSTYVREIGL